VTELLSRQEVAALVVNYRKASKSLRGLRIDHFGNVNVDTAQRHTRVMLESWAKLTKHGHVYVAEALSQWHSTLKQAYYLLSDEARSNRAHARVITGRINREVERIQ